MKSSPKKLIKKLPIQKIKKTLKKSIKKSTTKSFKKSPYKSLSIINYDTISNIKSKNELYNSNLSEYDKSCIRQWQMGGAAIVGSLNFDDEEIMFQISYWCGYKWKNVLYTLFPLAAQMRKYITKNQFEELIKTGKLSNLVKFEQFYNYPNIPETEYGKEQNKFDVASAFMKDFVQTLKVYGKSDPRAKHLYNQEPKTFLSNEWSEFMYNASNEYIKKYSMYNYLQSLPFTFNQLKEMAIQLRSDILRIIANAPKLNKDMLMYRGIKAKNVSIRKGPCSFSLKSLEAIKYLSGQTLLDELDDFETNNNNQIPSLRDLCCLQQLKIRKGSPIYMITKGVFEYPSQRDEYEVIIDTSNIIQEKKRYTDENKDNEILLKKADEYITIFTFSK